MLTSLLREGMVSREYFIKVWEPDKGEVDLRSDEGEYTEPC